MYDQMRPAGPTTTNVTVIVKGGKAGVFQTQDADVYMSKNPDSFDGAHVVHQAPVPQFLGLAMQAKVRRAIGAPVSVHKKDREKQFVADVDDAIAAVEQAVAVLDGLDGKLLQRALWAADDVLHHAEEIYRRFLHYEAEMITHGMLHLDGATTAPVAPDGATGQIYGTYLSLAWQMHINRRQMFNLVREFTPLIDAEATPAGIEKLLKLLTMFDEVNLPPVDLSNLTDRDDRDDRYSNYPPEAAAYLEQNPIPDRILAQLAEPWCGHMSARLYDGEREEQAAHAATPDAPTKEL